MSSATPLNIQNLENSYKKNSNLTFVILFLVTITLAVIAIIGFILIQKNSP